MNQTPAAILVLSSGVFCVAAQSASAHDQSSVVASIAAFAIGVWGVLSLIGSLVRERELLIDNHARLDIFNRLFVRDKPEEPKKPAEPPANDPYPDLPAEVHAQLNVVAEMEGRNRAEIIEETLRRHLPKYTKQRVA